MSDSKLQHVDTVMLGLFSIPEQSVSEYPLVYSLEWPAIKSPTACFNFKSKCLTTTQEHNGKLCIKTLFYGYYYIS